MGFESILDLKESPFKEEPRGCIYQDLNLDQIIERIENVWGDKVRQYFNYFPADEECAKFRADVSKDIMCDQVYDILCHFVNDYKESVKIGAKREVVRMAVQKHIYLIREIDVYCKALYSLKTELKQCELHSEGMKLLLEYLDEYLCSEQYRLMEEQAKDMRSQFDNVRLKISFESNQVVVELLQNSAEPREAIGSINGPFLDNVDLTGFEQEVLMIFQKKHPELLKQAEQFYKKYVSYAQETVARFAQEVCYYLSFYAFAKKMQEQGFDLSHPENATIGTMDGKEVYDLALACANINKDLPVIRNDFAYEAGKTFFVLTGPNQGGKTTFARCLGQLVFFKRMGLMIPAKNARIPYFHRILTHFSVEESVETGRGKLKEELTRLAPMMEERFEKAFVVINELFTTAADYDANIMGKNVLKRFIGAKCMGIYVTHLKELADADEAVQMIRATLDASRKQTFRIVNGAAPDIAYAQNQVEKHRLTYEQLKERLGGS